MSSIADIITAFAELASVNMPDDERKRTIADAQEKFKQFAIERNLGDIERKRGDINIVKLIDDDAGNK